MAVLETINSRYSKALARVAQGAEAVGEIFSTIVAGNTADIQNINETNRVLSAFEKDVPRVSGQAISFETLNIKFTKGDYQTASREFQSAWNSLTLAKAPGYNVGVLDLSDETILASQRGEVDIEGLNVKKVKNVMSFYVNSYLVGHRMHALITGNTLSPDLPTLQADGTVMNYGTFGFARGGSYKDHVTAGSPVVRNHYRCIKSATAVQVQSKDIMEAIKAIKTTKHYGKGGGQKGVVVLGEYFTIQSIANVANSNDTKDIQFGINADDKITVRSIYGAEFIPVEGMHSDYLIFLDKSYLNSGLIMRGHENAVNQMGLGLKYKENNQTFEKIEDLKGMDMRLFPEERFVIEKLSGLILDVNPDHFATTGVIGAGTPAETQLKTWVADMVAEYEFVD
jgi:hypothetical protein